MTALSLETEAAVTVAALCAAGRFPELGDQARDLCARGSRPADLREAAYLASLFCGFPRGVAALVALADLEPTGGDPAHYHEERPAAPRRRGREIFQEVHRANAGRRIAMLRSIHPDFADTVLREAYGRVMARAFLPLKVRELVGVASLTVLGLGPQLRAHLLGAHNTGATWEEVEAAVGFAGRLGGVDPEPALAAIAEIRARAPGA